MMIFHSKILNKKIKLASGSISYDPDAIIFEITEQDQLLKINPNITQLENICNLKEIFEGQLINYDFCEYCNCLIKLEQDQNGYIWKFNPNNDDLHICK